jgi:hypothetical protein
MNKWLKLVTKHKVSKYVVPPGWQTREEVARHLGCSEEKVNSNLKDAINAGDVEAKTFPVWCDIKQKVVPTPCYRIVEGGAAPAPKQPPRERPPKTTGWPSPVGTRVRRSDSKNLGTVIEGSSIHWDSGLVTTPSGSTRKKIVRA